MVSLWVLQVEEIIPLMLLPLHLEAVLPVLCKTSTRSRSPAWEAAWIDQERTQYTTLPQGGDIPGQFFLQSERWCDCGPHDPLPGQKHPPVPLGSIKKKKKEKQQSIAGRYAKWNTVCRTSKRKHREHYDSALPLLIYQKKWTHVPTKNCKQNFIAAPVIISKEWKKLKHVSADERINKM